MSNSKFIILLVIVTLLGGTLLVFSWFDKALSDKPIGPYRSAMSVKEAKKSKAWVATYSTDRKKYTSSDKSQTFCFKEVWIEKNRNNPKDFPLQSGYDYILNIHFKKRTSNNLHRFQLLGRSWAETEIINQAEYPDGGMRVRFLVRALNDTIKLAVQERNSKDSDTIVLIRK